MVITVISGFLHCPSNPPFQNATEEEKYWRGFLLHHYLGSVGGDGEERDNWLLMCMFCTRLWAAWEQLCDYAHCPAEHLAHSRYSVNGWWRKKWKIKYSTIHWSLRLWCARFQEPCHASQPAGAGDTQGERLDPHFTSQELNSPTVSCAYSLKCHLVL